MPTSTLWVRHPTTGKEINVAPLLLVLDEFDNTASGSSASHAGAALIDQVIRTMILSQPSPSITPASKRIDIFFDLYRLKDAFAEMAERESN